MEIGMFPVFVSNAVFTPIAASVMDSTSRDRRRGVFVVVISF
jgi:hypothetical protein